METKQHPQWCYNAVVYELNIRQFTKQGTIKAATRQLLRLKKLGITIIWLMPIFPIGTERRKGALGSYYSVKNYTEVNPEMGNKETLDEFIELAHKLNIKVILDWVANHTSRDAVWTKHNPLWYEWDNEKNELKTPQDWTDTAKLNFESQDMQLEMIKNMQYWVTEHNIDGFRCDMAMLVPIGFWEMATEKLGKQNIFMLAEAEGSQFHTAFDVTYAWEIHNTINQIAQGNENCYKLGEQLELEKNTYPKTALRLMFTDNHDENSWKNSPIKRYGTMGARCLAALSFILPGIPLIYNGQEVGMERGLEFFEKDSIDWENTPHSQNFTQLYTQLCQLKTSHPALLAAEKGGELRTLENNQHWRLFAVMRKTNNPSRVVIGLFNLSHETYTATITDSSFHGTFTQLIHGAKKNINPHDSIQFSPWEFMILYN